MNKYPVMSMAVNSSHLIQLHREVIDQLREELDSKNKLFANAIKLLDNYEETGFEEILDGLRSFLDEGSNNAN